MNGFTLELQSIGYKSQKFGAFFFFWPLPLETTGF
jgi:hypothetical protein